MAIENILRVLMIRLTSRANSLMTRMIFTAARGLTRATGRRSRLKKMTMNVPLPNSFTMRKRKNPMKTSEDRPGDDDEHRAGVSEVHEEAETPDDAGNLRPELDVLVQGNGGVHLLIAQRASL